jgi:hypothetical protein
MTRHLAFGTTPKSAAPKSVRSFVWKQSNLADTEETKFTVR